MNVRLTLIKSIPLLTLCLLVVPFAVNAQQSGTSATTLPNTFIPDVLWSVVNGFFGTLVAIAGQLLDFAIVEFVVNFGYNYQNSGIGGQVDLLWVTVRDLFNITFIFGLVYIGFRMILDSGNSQTRRNLVYLIIAALLVNFSLFFTKFIIDISNQLASQIAAPMVVNGVSTLFNNAMGLTTIWATNSQNGVSIFTGATSGAAFGYIFGALLIFIIATFVFASGAFMLLIRYIVLHLYLVMSPFMFIGFVFPQLMNVTRDYWRGFLGRVFYAPIYLLLLFFAASILTGTQNNISAQANLTNLSTIWGTGGGTIATANFISTVPPFLLASGFMLAAVIAGRRLGADGATTAINIGNNIRGRAQRGIRNAGYWSARQAGRGANAAGRGAVGATVRRTGMSAGLDRRLARLAQSESQVDRAIARVGDRTVGASLRNAAEKRVGSETVTQRNQRIQRQQNELNQRNQQSARAGYETGVTDNLPAQLAAYAAAVAAADRVGRRNAFNAAGVHIGRMSNDELVAGVRNGTIDIESDVIAGNLSDAQRNTLRDSGILSNEQSRNLNTRANNAAITETTQAFEDVDSSAADLSSTFNTLNQTIRNMSTDRKAGLGVSDGTGTPRASNLDNERVAVHLTDRDIEQLEQSGRFSAEQIQRVRTARANAQRNIASGDSSSFSPAGATLTTAQAGERQTFIEQQQSQMLRGDQRAAGTMPMEVFINPNMAEHLTPQVVAERMRNGLAYTSTGGSSINETTARNEIRSNIDRYITSAPNPTERTRRENVWRNASNRDPYIASLGLTSI